MLHRPHYHISLALWVATSLSLLEYKDLKALMADLKKVYAAVDEPSAEEALEAFSARWDKKYPKISASWRENWPT